VASREQYDRILAAGLRVSDLDDPACRRAWAWVEQHVRAHNTVPTPQALADLCGMALADPGVAPAYVLEQAQQRRTFRITRDAVAEAEGLLRNNDAAAALAALQAAVTAGAAVQAGDATPDTIFAHGAAVLDLYERTVRGEVGVPFPWPSMTKMTMGMWPGNFALFVGRPGTGKTVAALLIAIHAAMVANKRVLIISPEMSKLEIAERFFGFATRASLTGMVRGTLSGFEEQRLREYVAAMREHQNVWILDGTDTLTPAGMDAAIRKIGPDLVVIDSIYSLRVAGRTNTERTESALDWLNRSNKQHQYAAAVLSQQNRTKELSGKMGGGSRLGTIGFSDRLPQDANLIFAMEQDEDLKLAKRMKFVPLKTRRGFFEGPIETHWDFAASNFEEVARAPADEYVDEAFVPPASGYSQGQQVEAPF
jgi:KaiC/GvpD/RAD55 family RecA-like ATPase